MELSKMSHLTGYQGKANGGMWEEKEQGRVGWIIKISLLAASRFLLTNPNLFIDLNLQCDTLLP